MDPDVDLIVGCMGSQMSKTEGMLNVIGHRLDDGPYVPIIYVGPTEKLVKSMSRDRVDKMLRSCKTLWSKTEKGNRYGIGEKYISGVRLGFAWAGSPTEMASHPCGLMLIDERDRMSSDVGGEGDPVVLARARTKNYAFSKILVFSTPLIEGASPTWALLDQSTCEFWAVPCRHCLEFFVPQISLLRWPKGLGADDASQQAKLVCPNCGGEHETRDKEVLNAGGRFIQYRKLGNRENAPEGVRVVLEHYVPRETPKKSRQVGVWVSGLCSPWASFEYIAFNLINAYASKNPDTIQAVVNTDGGELYRVRGDAPEWQEVANNRLEYPPEIIPDPQVQIITLGADVQKYGIYVVIRGWGPAAESWLLYHDYLVGETEYDDIWVKLGNLLTRDIQGKRIMRGFIDSGYRPGDTHSRPDHAVYSFCRRHRGLAFPTKGRDTMDRPFRFNDIDYSIGGRLIKNGVRLYHINTDHFKSWIHARVTWPESDHGGGWHLHNQTTEDYCKQIVSEELVIKSSGKKVWVKIADDNHYLDAEVGATAAAYSLNVHQLVRNRELQPPDLQQSPAKQGSAQRQGYQRESLF